MPLIALGVIGAVGSIAGGAIASSGAKSAANTQANAADYAAQLQSQDAQKALAFQEQQYNNSLNLEMPYVQAGYGGLANLDYLLGIGGNPYAPVSPTNGLGGGAMGGPQNTAAGQAIRGGQTQLPVGPHVTQINSPYVTPGQPGQQQAPPYLQTRTALSGNRLQLLGADPTSGPTGNSPTLAQAGYGTAAAPGVTSIGPQNISGMIDPSLGGYGSLMQGWNQTFQAPTDITEQNDPGYQARLKLGTDAMQRSAAASGGLLTGGTLKDLNQFGQDFASNEYGNVYNRAYNQYATNYNQFEQNQANQYNRLASLAGLGQVNAGQLAQIGTQTGANIGNTLLTSGQQIGQQINNAGAARASGYAASGNIWGNTVSGLGNNLAALMQLYGSQNAYNNPAYANDPGAYA